MFSLTDVHLNNNLLQVHSRASVKDVQMETYQAQTSNVVHLDSESMYVYTN